MGEDVFVFGTAPLGVLFMLAASVSWAIGTVLFKKYRWQTPVSTLVGWQMATAAVPITIVAMLTEQLPNIAHLSGHTIIALIYTFLLPMMFCQWAFFKVVSMFPASIASIGTLAVPVIGVYSSALVLGEPVGWHEIAALVLICAALTSVLVVPTLRRR
jgi:drug/metabolite transporter (DMT)-like permease